VTVLVLESATDPLAWTPRAPSGVVERASDAEGTLARIERGGVTAVVVGPGVEGPVRLGQRLRLVDPKLPVVLIVRPDRASRTRRAAAFALGDGRPIDVLTTAEIARVDDTVTGDERERAGVDAKVAHAALRCFDRLLERGPVGLVLGDSAGIIVSVNARARALLGVDEHDALGLAIDTVLPGVDWKQHVPATDVPPVTHVVRPRAEGPVIRIAVHTAPPCDGAESHCALLLVDSSEEKSGTEKVDRLRQLQLDLLSMISHDIRAPLGVIVGAVNELGSADVGALNDEQRFLLGLVKKSVERLSRLAANVVFLGRMESGQLQMKRRPSDLRPTVKQVADDLQRIDAGTSVTVHTSIPTEPLIAEVDIERFGQVLTNLLSNAIRFAKKDVWVELRADEQVVQVRVTDDGPGVPADALARIFERFSRQDAPKSGTGLGLAIVHGIVTAHGGSVRAENRRDTVSKLPGASFTVILPRRAT